MIDEGKDVLLPVFQGGDLDGDDIQAVEQILPELLSLGHVMQIPVGGRQNPHIHFPLPVGAHGTHRPAFQHMEELGLDGQGEFADFVQKEGTGFGLRE
jgi:hypothetical protein